jgi:hypothetical protein
MTIKYSLQSSLLLDRNEGINITQEDVSSLHSQLIQWKALVNAASVKNDVYLWIYTIKRHIVMI